MSDEKAEQGPGTVTHPGREGPDTALTAVGVSVNGTQWFMQLNFQEALAINQSLVERTTAAVRVPWPLAKALHEVLGTTLAKYEETEGLISLPRSFAIKHEARVKQLAATPPVPKARGRKKK